ncbi:MAG TPA: universal stress protein [Candidatus Elarobacter sp.]|nr:universal stress protein [Candidatus Elarobacter sp.]
MAFLSRSRSPDSPDSADESGTSSSPPRNRTTLQRVIVVCDGVPEGDNAAQLAASIARNTSASVRAVTWLTPTVAHAAAAMDKAPIEEMLDRVTQQLYRCTRNPGFWRLALVTGDFAPAVSKIVRTEQADLVIIPGPHATADAAARIARATGMPVARVFGRIDREDFRVRITVAHQAASQRMARIAASVITTAFRRESGVGSSAAAPIEMRNASVLRATSPTDGDDSGFTMID